MTKVLLFLAGIAAGLAAGALLQGSFLNQDVEVYIKRKLELKNKPVWAALQLKSAALADEEMPNLPTVVDVKIGGENHRVLIVKMTDTRNEVALTLLDMDMDGFNVFSFPPGATFDASCSEIGAAIGGESVLPSVSDFLVARCASLG